MTSTAIRKVPADIVRLPFSYRARGIGSLPIVEHEPRSVVLVPMLRTVPSEITRHGGGTLRLVKSALGLICEDAPRSDGGPLVAHAATVEVPVCSFCRARNLKDRATSAIPKAIA
jgi:hypothetical protein